MTAAGRAVAPEASAGPAAAIAAAGPGAMASHAAPGGAATPREDDPLVVQGPSLSLRYAAPADAERLLELGSDPAVTRFFSWGPYTDLAQPRAYIAELPGRRARGEQLDFVVVHPDDGAIGVTGLSELSRRDRRATTGSWLGHRWWGTGANFEAKALLAALAFGPLGLERLTATASTRNGRSQVALERLGFRREGVLAAWHRHGGVSHDVVVFGLVRPAWERSRMRAVPVAFHGTPPDAFVAG